MVLALDDLGVRLAGPSGEGLPEISSHSLVLNGLANCGHLKNEDICISFPACYASGIGSSINSVTDPWFIGARIKYRTCNGDCSYESLNFERIAESVAPQAERGAVALTLVKAGFRPYDLAIQCLLLISKHHLDQ
jgi:hypothetical protein